MPPSQAAVELVTQVNLSTLRGLYPDDYDVNKLPALMLLLSTPAQRADYDVAFSANAIRADARIARRQTQAVRRACGVAHSGAKDLMLHQR